ncbi:MAG TPA: glycosyltransferase family 2 protein [Candidatus Bathyarchaeia archaeon]
MCALEPEFARLAVVMPVFNEEDNIRSTLLEASEKITKVHDKVIFVVSEDGSTDNTKSILASLASQMTNLDVHLGPSRKGYPMAARDAILGLDGRTDYILFMDSDGQYDPSDFGVLWKELGNDSPDMVVGRRMNRAEPPLRVFFSTALRIIERALFRVKNRDITSAFRLMRREPAQTIARRVKYSKYNFWLEFNAIASLSPYSTTEVPVAYRARKGESRVYPGAKLARAAIQELTTILRVWTDLRVNRKQWDPSWNGASVPTSQ